MPWNRFRLLWSITSCGPSGRRTKAAQAARDNIYDRWRMADTPAKQADLLRPVQKYNLTVMKYREMVPPVSMASMRQARKSELTKAQERFAELYQR